MNIKDLIPFLEENKKEIKIHCATGSTDVFAPKKSFLNGKFKEWQEEQNQKNFERKYILSLIFWDKDEWLFAGIYESLNVKQNGNGRFVYETKLLDVANEFIGKTIFKFKKDFRNSYLCLENHIGNINLLEIKRDVVKQTLERTPPELASDIMERGIMLTGGGALIRDIDKLLSAKTGMPVYVAENPLDCVVKGAGKTLEDLEKLKSILLNARRR